MLEKWDANRWSKSFLLCLGGYYVLILNQHFNIPLRYIPWVLLIFSGFVFWQHLKDGKNLIDELIPFFSEREIFLLLLSLSIVSLCFCISTQNQPDGISGWFALITIYLGPIFLAFAAFVVLPKTATTISYLCAASIGALVFLEITDILHYCRDLYQSGTLGQPVLHRWFSDGYLFFAPWLFLGFFSSKSRISKFVFSLIILLLPILLFATAGSRGSMIVTATEAILFSILYRSHYSRVRRFLTLLFFVLCGLLGASWLSPHALHFSLNRGLFVGDRTYDAWLPVLEFIRQKLALGYGFGRAAWDQAYENFYIIHPGWPGNNMGGPHNNFLDVTFIGGLPALIFFCIFCYLIASILFKLVINERPALSGPSLAALCSFVGLYLVRGLVESIRWEPLGIILMWTLLLSYLSQKQSLLE